MRHKIKDMTQATSCFMKKQKTYNLDKISLAKNLSSWMVCGFYRYTVTSSSYLLI